MDYFEGNNLFTQVYDILWTMCIDGFKIDKIKDWNK